MPQSKRKGSFDYSDAKFRSLWPDPPPAIQRMIDRALDSFGLDLKVLQRWTGTVRTPKGSKSERQFFPHNSRDICCADGAGFVLYQSGVVDLGMNRNIFRPPGGAAIHAANNYAAHGGNTDFCYELPRIDPSTEVTRADRRDWLPGDIFLYYGKRRGPKVAEHVNIYLGDFVEVVDGADVEDAGGPYCFFNSSIGTAAHDWSAHCIPMTWERNLRSVRNLHRTYRRVRVRAIEQLFRDQVSAPVAIREQEQDSPGLGHLVRSIGEVWTRTPPRPEIPWAVANASAAPYPIGRNLTWHDGVHFLRDRSLADDSVSSFAAGEIVAARFGPTTHAGDTSFVLVRHRIVTSELRLLGAPPVDETARRAEEKQYPSAKLVYSLYMHMAPLATYLDEATEIEPGLPRLYVPGDAIPDGKAPAPEWLRRLWPMPKPALIDMVRESAELSLVAWTRSGSGAAQLHRLSTPTDLTARHGWPLSQLRSVDIDGATHWLVPVPGGDTNAEAWDGSIPHANAPHRRKLTYFNPQSGNTFDTPITLPATAELAQEEQDGRVRLVRVVGPDGTPIASVGRALCALEDYDRPGLDLGRLRQHYDYDDATKLVELAPDATRVKLYTQTSGEGARRRFSPRSAIDLTKATEDRAFVVAEQRATGGRYRSSRAWLDLVPGVWMSEAEIAAAEQRISDRGASLRLSIKERLAAGLSFLAGVKISRRSGWEMHEGHVRAEGDGPSDHVTIYRQITGRGRRRRFTELPKRAGAEQEQNLVLEIEAPGPDVAFYAVDNPGRRAHSAVFELMFATTEVGTNQEEIDEIEELNRQRRPIAKKLLDGAMVDLRSEEGVTQQMRNIAHVRLGEMGAVPGPTDALTRGVHFEIFSGTNLVDASVAGSDGAMVPVPRTPFLVYADSAEQDFFSPEFVDRVVRVLRAQVDAHHLDLQNLATAFGEDGVVSPEEWIELCWRNQRQLSRLITVHPPEWKIDWSQEIDALSRGRHVSPEERDALASAAAELRWWKDDLSLDEIEGNRVFYYHPLRFIEWLSTGVDFVIVNPSRGRNPKVKIRPHEGGAEIELVKTGKGTFRFRPFVGEGAKDEALYHVTLEDVPTANPEFTVVVRRGIVSTVRLVEPGHLQKTIEPGAADPRKYFERVEVTRVGGTRFLADGDRHLQESGYDRATIVFSVAFNHRMPERATFDLPGGDFQIVAHAVDGANATVASERPLTLQITDPSRRAHVESSRVLSVRVRVRAVTQTIDARATLTATFSGGDLAEDAQGTVALSTRKIVVEKKTSARDVAKLQLYLSQIHAADDRPCYRDFKADSRHHGPPVDGVYSRELARGIWRFIYGHARDADWHASSIASMARPRAAPTPVTLEEIRAVPEQVVRDGDASDAMEGASEPEKLYAKRVGGRGKTYTHYPVVDGPLLAEIVARFRPPFVLPHIDVYFEKTEIEAPAGASVVADWNADGRRGKSAILPIASDRLPVRLAIGDAAGTGDWDLQVVVEIPAASAYRFLDPLPTTRITRSLRELASTPILSLQSSLSITRDPEENLLTVKTMQGRLLGSRSLFGARDLSKAQPGHGCRDAALVQRWLSQIPDAAHPGRMVYTKSHRSGRGRHATTTLLIDGKWDQDCVEALERFRAQSGLAGASYPALIEFLRITAASHRADR